MLRHAPGEISHNDTLVTSGCRVAARHNHMKGLLVEAGRIESENFHFLKEGRSYLNTVDYLFNTPAWAPIVTFTEFQQLQKLALWSDD